MTWEPKCQESFLFSLPISGQELKPVRYTRVPRSACLERCYLQGAPGGVKASGQMALIAGLGSK